MPTTNWLTSWVKVNSKHVSYREQIENGNLKRGGGKEERKSLRDKTASTTPSSQPSKCSNFPEYYTLPQKRIGKKNRRRQEQENAERSNEIPKSISVSFNDEDISEAEFLNDTTLNVVVESRSSHSSVADAAAAAIRTDEESCELEGALPPPLIQSCARCMSCEEKDAQLVAALQNLEYVRTIKVQEEYKSCSAESAVLAAAAATSSKLAEFENNHQREIEELNQAHERLQQDAQRKLNELSTLCSVLKEETATSKNENKILSALMTEIEQERDELAAELTRVRAEMAAQQQEHREFAALRRKCTSYETGMQRLGQALEERDALIHDLSSKLEEALKELEQVRSLPQEQQRRQRRAKLF